MRHNVAGRKLGRTSEHRKAMMRNQLVSLIQAGRIQTTLAKAKALRPVAEKVITRSKTDTVHSRRMVGRWIQDRDVIKKLFHEIGPRVADRPGGYTRIVKLGPRQGDGAERAVIELVDEAEES
ncbi:MAG: 50S ribosomal protein L17 [Thermoanaerobaculia bacterium]